jgi:PAS domain S-box-containing protein
MLNSSEHLRALIDAVLVSLVVIDDDGTIRAMNRAAERLFGHPEGELVGHGVRAIVPGIELPTGTLGPVSEAEPARAGLGTHKDGTSIALELLLSEMTVGAEHYYVLAISVISARTRADARLRYRLELESTVADISRRFVHADGASLDATIDWALARMGTVTGVDRGYVFQFSEDGATFCNTHEWCAEGIAPQIQDLEHLASADFQGMLSIMARGEMVYVPRAADLPDSEALLRSIMLEGGIQSYINAPIIWDGRLRGFLGFDAVREAKTFPDEDMRLLGTVAEIMGRSMANHQAAVRVAENAWFLENLDRVTGLFARSQDSRTALEQLAALLLEVFQADRAFYIFPCDPDAPRFRVPIEATRPEYPGAFARGVEIPMEPAIQDQIREALASDMPITLDITSLADPPPAAVAFHIQSVILAVLRPKKGPSWLLGLHQCSHPRQWSAAERRLLQAIAERMGDALSLHLAHQELRLSEERLAIVLRSNPAIIYAITMSSPVRCTYISPNVEHILGYTPDEVMGTPDWLRPVIHPDDHDRTFTALQASLQCEGRANSIYRARKKDGEYIWLQDQLTMHPNDPQQAIGCMIDISQRISVEQELERARTAAEQALATAQDRLHMLEMAEQLAHFGHWQVTYPGGVVSWSDEMYRIHGISPGSGVAPPDMATLLDHYYLYDKEEVAGIVAKAIAERSVVRTELQIKRPDGTMGWLLSLTKAELDEHDNIIGSFGVSQDITERKEIEAALVKAREDALAASRVKSQFLANMSHEIRTPLNGVLGMTELLLDTPLSADQRELLEMVRSSGRSLYELIEDVLDISKIEAGKIELQAVPFSLRDVVQDAARMVAVRAYEKGLELVVDVAPEAPGRVIGDPVRFRQILTNLLANAVKFTPRGEIELDVSRAPEGNIAIRVRDTGIGIPPDRRDAIFEAFIQADSSTTREYGGTGLGLAICRELVERMGGRIWVEQGADGGSVFRVVVSLPEVEPEVESSRAPQHATPLLAGARVLVVEGNATTARVLSRLLYSWHLEPMVCANESEAFSAVYEALYQDRPFRFGLIDAALGTRSGIELARTLARDPRFAAMARILLVSASWRPDPSLLSSDVVSRCLVKPISPSTLLDALLTCSAAAASPAGRSAEPAPRSIQTPGLRVLLAEDNPMNALLIKRVLARSECSVAHVTTGMGALAAWERQRFDIILMDMQMPELDGLEATRRIRAQERERGVRTPIVALTANAMKEDEQRCLDAGMDGYLPKPIEIGRLLQVLERLPRLRARARAFDPRALLDQLGDDHQTAALLVASFLDSAPGVLAGLEEIFAAGELEALARAAHHARGSLLALHAQPAAAAALELELAAKNREIEGLPARMAELREAWRRLVDELRAFGQA